MKNLRKGISVNFQAQDIQPICGALKQIYPDAGVSQHANNNYSIALNGVQAILFEQVGFRGIPHLYAKLDDSALSPEDFSKVERVLNSIGITIDKTFLNPGILAVIGIVGGSIAIGFLGMVFGRVIIWIGIPLLVMALVLLKFILLPKLGGSNEKPA
ncbi:MAG: hypothetical protein ABIG20_03440 [archaeon]